MPVKKPAKPTEPPSNRVKSTSGAAAVPAARDGHPKTPREKAQPEVFEEAVKAQHAGDFSRAKTLFEEAAHGPNREMAHAARTHARMCEHRMAKADPILKSAEDHYNFAVTLMNQRSLEKAEQHLRTALHMMSDADHVHYALALCRGLRGDLDDARKHLQCAIELQPKNRVMARNDPDFLELNRNRALTQILYPEGTPSA